MGKKRKPELDLDVERSMYASFVTAANAVSQLYTTGIAQQRRTAVAASRATLEKVLGFVLRENGGGETVSKAALLHFLQHEYESLDCPDMAAPTPQFFLPSFGAAAPSCGSDGQDVQQKAPSRQPSMCAMAASPGLRSRQTDLDEQHLAVAEVQQQQQQQQQQALHAMQQHLQQAQQQQQQQQSALMHATTPFTGGGMFMQSSGQGMH